MATKRKKYGTAATKRRKRKSTAKKGGFMGMGSLNSLGNQTASDNRSTGQKLLQGALVLASGLIVGGAAGAYVGKNSGLLGVAAVMGGNFLPTKYQPYVAAAGLGMVIASPKMLDAPDTAKTATPTPGISGFDAKDFHEKGVLRFKNFISDLSEKAYLPESAKKTLGLGAVEQVSYYDQPVIGAAEYERLLAKAMSESNTAARQQTYGNGMMGTDNILAGLGTLSGTDNILAGLGQVSQFIDA